MLACSVYFVEIQIVNVPVLVVVLLTYHIDMLSGLHPSEILKLNLSIFDILRA